MPPDVAEQVALRQREIVARELALAEPELRRHITAKVCKKGLAKSHAQRQALVDEIISVVSEDLLKKASQYDPSQRFVPWAVAFSRFSILAVARERGHQRSLPEDDRSGDAWLDLLDRADADDAQARSDAKEIIGKVLKQLTPGQLEVIELRYFQDLPHAAIGARLGISEHAAKVRVFRAVIACSEIGERLMGKEGSR